MKIGTCLLLSAISCGIAFAADNLKLANGGKSDYRIIVPATPTPVEQTAAKELQEHFQKVTGALLPILNENAADTQSPAFRIGNTGIFDKQFGNNPELAKIDAIAMGTSGNDIILGGHPKRGPLYAVYTFLEDYVGIRWWTSTESTIPSKPDLTVPRPSQVYAPKIYCRETFYRDAFQPAFASRLKNNGHFARITSDYGGHYTIIGWCHTFFRFIPPKDYFDKHPEWFSLINGKRTADHSQLCLTNEEVRKEFVKQCLIRIKQNPDAGIISVAQNDWHGWCECPNCKAIQDREGGESGVLLHFVNYVADEIAKVYPDYLVETLAYQKSRHAPKHIKPAKNVVIRLCSIEMNFAQTLENGPDNASFKKDIEDWSAIAQHLFIWNYVTNFHNYMLPHPNYRALAPDIRFFEKHNAIGVFEQGDSGSMAGDFVRMRTWVTAHLLWNPSLDENALFNEFLEGYYGPAAKHLRKYINLICDAVEKENFNLRCFLISASGWLKADTITEAYKIFQEAEKAVADNPVLKERVRRDRLSLDVAYLRYIPRFIRANLKDDGSAPVIGPDPVKIADEFITLSNPWKDNTNIKEGGRFSNYAVYLKDTLNSISGVTPVECKGIPLNMWDNFGTPSFNLFGVNRWSKIIEDKAATNGIAAWMTGNTNQWAVQCPVECYDSDSGTWVINVWVRCEADATDGPAIKVGVYSPKTQKEMSKRDISIKECAGSDYKMFSLKPVTFDSSCYIWFAPANRPLAELKAVYIDRISIIKQK